MWTIQATVIESLSVRDASTLTWVEWMMWPVHDVIFVRVRSAVMLLKVVQEVDGGDAYSEWNMRVF